MIGTRRNGIGHKGEKMKCTEIVWMAWLLVGIAWLAAVGCSPEPSGNHEEQQPEYQVVEASVSQEQQEASNTRVDELLEAALIATIAEDWDAVVSNARAEPTVQPFDDD